MKSPKYERKGLQIKNLETGEIETFKSRNLCKKASHKLTLKKGLGIVRAVWTSNKPSVKKANKKI